MDEELIALLLPSDYQQTATASYVLVQNYDDWPDIKSYQRPEGADGPITAEEIFAAFPELAYLPLTERHKSAFYGDAIGGVYVNDEYFHLKQWNFPEGGYGNTVYDYHTDSFITMQEYEGLYGRPTLLDAFNYVHETGEQPFAQYITDMFNEMYFCDHEVVRMGDSFMGTAYGASIASQAGNLSDFSPRFALDSYDSYDAFIATESVSPAEEIDMQEPNGIGGIGIPWVAGIPVSWMDVALTQSWEDAIISQLIYLSDNALGPARIDQLYGEDSGIAVPDVQQALAEFQSMAEGVVAMGDMEGLVFEHVMSSMFRIARVGNATLSDFVENPLSKYGFAHFNHVYSWDDVAQDLIDGRVNGNFGVNPALMEIIHDHVAEGASLFEATLHVVNSQYYADHGWVYGGDSFPNFSEQHLSNEWIQYLLSDLTTRYSPDSEEFTIIRDSLMRYGQPITFGELFALEYDGEAVFQEAVEAVLHELSTADDTNLPLLVRENPELSPHFSSGLQYYATILPEVGEDILWPDPGLVHVSFPEVMPDFTVAVERPAFASDAEHIAYLAEEGMQRYAESHFVPEPVQLSYEQNLQNFNLYIGALLNGDALPSMSEATLAVGYISLINAPSLNEEDTAVLAQITPQLQEVIFPENSHAAQLFAAIASQASSYRNDPQRSYAYDNYTGELLLTLLTENDGPQSLDEIVSQYLYSNVIGRRPILSSDEPFTVDILDIFSEVTARDAYQETVTSFRAQGEAYADADLQPYLIRGLPFLDIEAANVIVEQAMAPAIANEGLSLLNALGTVSLDNPNMRAYILAEIFIVPEEVSEATTISELITALQAGGEVGNWEIYTVLSRAEHYEELLTTVHEALTPDIAAVSMSDPLLLRFISNAFPSDSTFDLSEYATIGDMVNAMIAMPSVNLEWVIEAQQRVEGYSIVMQYAETHTIPDFLLTPDIAGSLVSRIAATSSYIEDRQPLFHEDGSVLYSTYAEYFLLNMMDQAHRYDSDGTLYPFPFDEFAVDISATVANSADALVALDALENLDSYISEQSKGAIQLAFGERVAAILEGPVTYAEFIEWAIEGQRLLPADVLAIIEFAESYPALREGLFAGREEMFAADFSMDSDQSVAYENVIRYNVEHATLPFYTAYFAEEGILQGRSFSTMSELTYAYAEYVQEQYQIEIAHESKRSINGINRYLNGIGMEHLQLPVHPLYAQPSVSYMWTTDSNNIMAEILYQSLGDRTPQDHIGLQSAISAAWPFIMGEEPAILMPNGDALEDVEEAANVDFGNGITYRYDAFNGYFWFTPDTDEMLENAWPLSIVPSAEGSGSNLVAADGTVLYRHIETSRYAPSVNIVIDGVDFQTLSPERFPLVDFYLANRAALSGNDESAFYSLFTIEHYTDEYDAIIVDTPKFHFENAALLAEENFALHFFETEDGQIAFGNEQGEYIVNPSGLYSINLEYFEYYLNMRFSEHDTVESLNEKLDETREALYQFALYPFKNANSPMFAYLYPNLLTDDGRFAEENLQTHIENLRITPEFVATFGPLLFIEEPEGALILQAADGSKLVGIESLFAVGFDFTELSGDYELAYPENINIDSMNYLLDVMYRAPDMTPEELHEAIENNPALAVGQELRESDVVLDDAGAQNIGDVDLQYIEYSPPIEAEEPFLLM